MVSKRWRTGPRSSRRLTSLEERSDAELLVASRADPDAFHHLYLRHAEPLLGYLYRRTGDAQVAADLLAETFATAFARRRRFTPRPDRPGSTWLYGIARREVAAYHRRNAVELRAVQRLGLQVPELTDDDIERIESIVDADSAFAEIEPGLDELSDRERQAVQLRFAGDVGYEEVGRAIGISSGAARVRVHRGLRKLATFVRPAR